MPFAVCYPAKIAQYILPSLFRSLFNTPSANNFKPACRLRQIKVTPAK
ncbi:hypothetical protein RNAN_0394 [Rheinheimera nanhaiensis E407-8]|uniref:Uncharacterized protein n=1 Tax=Rheinheimera nanhaiensis E407-8 TaxID=562729 RepID=I1DTP8_9GAMM|nr:hypothetical protein RNAN_0394 [Rheinheimera nanhaiensis E407-8]